MCNDIWLGNGMVWILEISSRKKHFWGRYSILYTFHWNLGCILLASFGEKHFLWNLWIAQPVCKKPPGTKATVWMKSWGERQIWYHDNTLETDHHQLVTMKAGFVANYIYTWLENFKLLLITKYGRSSQKRILQTRISIPKPNRNITLNCAKIGNMALKRTLLPATFLDLISNI